MSRKRCWLLVGAGALILTLLVAAVCEPNQIVIGWFHGDDFFDWRPTRFWRELLREKGQNQVVEVETIKALSRRRDAVPILRVCARDEDRDVRWPAVAILGWAAVHDNAAALPGLREALKDEDADIRSEAVLGLRRLGPNAMAATDDLVACMKDPVGEVAHLAHQALWDVNKKRAIKEGDWKVFKSTRWGFSAEFPGVPKEEQKPNPLAAGNLTTHSFTASDGVSTYIVAITDNPADFFKGTAEERLDMGRDMMLFGLGASLRDEKPYVRGSVKGREYTADRTQERNGHKFATIMKSCVFWIERRQYQVLATYSEEFSVIRAVEHFLDSFEYRPKLAGGS